MVSRESVRAQPAADGQAHPAQQDPPDMQDAAVELVAVAGSGAW